MKKINWQINKHNKLTSNNLRSKEEMNRILQFHQTIPGYFPTPLFSLKDLAHYLGLRDILVKDESHRFGLNSFKVLGSSYAIAHYLNGKNTAVDSFPNLKEKLKDLPVRTFATATAGNHGLGVAWSAKQLGQQAVIYLPKGSSPYKLNKLREWGAQAEITTLNYDDTVRYVSKLSEEKGWVLVQDTAWNDYMEIPTRIMQGYLTMVGECLKQLQTLGKESPTHVILQAGVGSFAGALAEGLKQHIKEPITFIIVEPNQADCMFQSGLSTDAVAKNSKGDLSTIMAGLASGKANPIAWDILKNTANCFVTCPDEVTAKGMRILGNPLGKDPRIISGESGAIPLGLLVEICKNPLLIDLKQSLGLTASSRVLFFSTEGDTNPENYRAICWDGIYGSA